MEGDLPPDVAGHQLRTEPGDSRRLVTHYTHDPSQGPFAAPRAEQWKRQRRPIGRGGQGDVYVQERIDSSATQLRAVKMIRCSGDSGKQRYVRELQTMVRFSHDQYASLFVRMIGWYLIEDYVCIVMEYLSEGDLQTYLNNRPPLPESECKQVISQVVRGVDMMHSANVAHRDIKLQQRPTPEGEGGWWVKLADFGIAKRIDTTDTVVGIGTQEYMAPELQGVPGLNAGGQIDRKAADIWAIGIMYFLMQTQKRGFLLQRRDYSDSDSIIAHYHMSSQAADFLLKATSWIPSSRPDTGDLMVHPWIVEFIPQRPQVRALPDNLSLHSGSSDDSNSDLAANPETDLASAVWDTDVTGNLGQASTPTPGVMKPKNPASPDAPSRGEVAKSLLPTTDAKATWNTSKRLTFEPREDAEPQLPSNDTTKTAEESMHEPQPSSDLHQLIASGDTEGVRRAVDGFEPVLFRHLLLAARKGHLEIVNIVAGKVSRTMGVSTPAANGWTALHHAASKGHAAVVRSLVETFSADLTAKTHEGMEASFLAVQSRDIETISLFVSYDRPLDGLNLEEFQALRFAVGVGDSELVKFLLNGPAMYAKVDDIDRIAAVKGDVDIVKMLVWKGVGFASRDIQSGNRPLHLAAYNGHTQLVQFLSESVDLDVPNLMGLTPLDIACREGHLDMVRHLIMSTVKHRSATHPAISFPLKPLVVALGHAARSRQTRVVELLLNLQTAHCLRESPRPNLSFESQPYQRRLGSTMEIVNRESMRAFARRRDIDWIGIASDTKMFALKFSLPAKSNRAEWSLYNGSSPVNSPLVVGGALSPVCGLSSTCLDSVLHMSNVYGKPEEHSLADGGTVILRARRVATGRQLAFRFSRLVLSENLSSSWTKEQTLERKMWEWRQIWGMPNKYQLVQCSKASTLDSSKDVQPDGPEGELIYPSLYGHEESGSPLATLDIRENLMSPASFRFQFVNYEPDSAIVILALGTAIQIWKFTMSGQIDRADPDGLSLLVLP